MSRHDTLVCCFSFLYQQAILPLPMTTSMAPSTSINISLIRLYYSVVYLCPIESIGYVDPHGECEHRGVGKSRMRPRIPHSNCLWCVGTFIALALLFTGIAHVNQRCEPSDIKRVISKT